MPQDLYRLFRDVPESDAPYWIVEFQAEYDDPNTVPGPLDIARQAYKDIAHGHSCTVYHVRSGLMWSVNLENSECVEVVRHQVR